MTYRAGQDRALPEHLHDAYEWIESAGDWDEAMTDPTYPEQAARNAREQGETNIHVDDLINAIEWQVAKRRA